MKRYKGEVVVRVKFSLEAMGNEAPSRIAQRVQDAFAKDGEVIHLDYDVVE